MNEKMFKFDDNSFIRFQILEDGSLSVSLQARHLDKEYKHTSSSVVLTKEETYDFANWFEDILISMEPANE